MRLLRIASVEVLCILFAAPASALTISNADPAAHTITVTAGSDSKEITVAPAQQVDATCPDGCKVKLENGEEYDLKGTEQVSIEDGVIFVDNVSGNDDDNFPDIDPDAEPDNAVPADDTSQRSATAPSDGPTEAVPQRQ
jgi:hypothetical protein